jgi:hypothetical protein
VILPLRVDYSWLYRKINASIKRPLSLHTPRSCSVWSLSPTLGRKQHNLSRRLRCRQLVRRLVGDTGLHRSLLPCGAFVLCHCEKPTGLARSGRRDDRLRDEAIQAHRHLKTGLLRCARNDGAPAIPFRLRAAGADEKKYAAPHNRHARPPPLVTHDAAGDTGCRKLKNKRNG